MYALLFVMRFCRLYKFNIRGQLETKLKEQLFLIIVDAHVWGRACLIKPDRNGSK